MEALASTPNAVSTLPPGPRTPHAWRLLRYVLRPYAALESSVRPFGDRYTIEAMGMPGKLVMFADPEGIRDIFSGDGDTLRAGEAVGGVIGPLVGWHSILLLDGERHLRERRMMSPPFHGERMHVYGRLMRDIAARAIDALAGRPAVSDPPRDAVDHPRRDHPRGFRRRPGGALRSLSRPGGAFRRASGGPSAPFIALRPFQIDLGRYSPWGRFVRNRRTIRDRVLAEIARRRADGMAGRTDILSLLLEARDEHGAPMGDDALVDEMFTLLMAGHETTATSLAWVVWHLLQHPDVAHDAPRGDRARDRRRGARSARICRASSISMR